MELIETRLFTSQVQSALTAEEYRLLQLQLIVRPESGDLIRGSGGLRKVRCRLAGRGKRGGARVVYYWNPVAEQIFLLLLYPKGAQSNLSPSQLRTLRRLVAEE